MIKKCSKYPVYQMPCITW